MSDARAPRVALVHAVFVAIEPIRAAFARGWPEAELVNLLDDSLSPDRARDGDLTEAMSRRIGALGTYAEAAGADAILYTCSAFGPAIEAVARQSAVPVLKPNEAMFERALGAGGRIGMVATFPPSVASMEAEFREQAQAAGREASLRTVLAEGAMDALRSGDETAHNRLVAEAAGALAECDALLLAHFSTSRARAAVEAVTGQPVLTSPDCAVDLLRTRLGPR